MQSFKASKLQRNIFKTLVYADIFDYPLNSEELHRFLIADKSLPFSVFKNALTRIHTNEKRIDTNEEYFFLRGRNEIVELRKKKGEWSRKKWEIARKAADKLKIIPTIKVIGVTGALAMENCKENDDIDLLIITSPNCLWLTRLLVLTASFLSGIKRRKPEDKDIKDKICFNLFLDEDRLTIKPENLFLAHEIVQMKPVFDRGGVYGEFMLENRWVGNFLPNSSPINEITIKRYNDIAKKKGIAISLSRYLAIFEKIAFVAQYLYMKSKITNEKVSLHQAFFHPKDLQGKIMKEYNQKNNDFR